MLTSGKLVILIGNASRSTVWWKGYNKWKRNAKMENEKTMDSWKSFQHFSLQIELSLSSMTLRKLVCGKCASTLAAFSRFFNGQWLHSVMGFRILKQKQLFSQQISIDISNKTSNWFQCNLHSLIKLDWNVYHRVCIHFKPHVSFTTQSALPICIRLVNWCWFIEIDFRTPITIFHLQMISIDGSDTYGCWMSNTFDSVLWTWVLSTTTDIQYGFMFF